MKPIYLDYNATTPLAPEVIEAMRPFIETNFGNPSSSHYFGKITKQAIENARTQVASLINCSADEIIFTSGGTESNNWALKGAAFANQKKGNHIIISAIEHPAITEVCKYLETCGFQISIAKVDQYGMINLTEIERQITSKTFLVSVMHANNEIGTIQPIQEIAAIIKNKNILFHTDAAQSIGKIKTDVKRLNIDLLSIAGHKVYAPKGIGALFIKKGTTLGKLIHGANHESGLRAGTENVIQIVALGKACEISLQNFNIYTRHMKEMRDLLHQKISQNFPHVKLNGHPENRLPNTLSLSFKDINAGELIESLSDKVALSAGSACHAGEVKMSSVLAAIHLEPAWAKGTIRFSAGRNTTVEEIEQTIILLKDALVP